MPFSSDGPGAQVPTGGLTLWESSIELRAPVYGKLGTALFLDGSNISRVVGIFDFSASRRRLSRRHLKRRPCHR